MTVHGTLHARRKRHGLAGLARYLSALFRTERRDDERAAHRMVLAERRGLQLILLCRTAAFLVATAFYVASMVLSGFRPTPTTVAALLAMTALGIVDYIAIGTRWDRRWYKYALLTADVALICTLIGFMPLRTGFETPQILAFRMFGIFLLFPVVTLSALSFSPRLVLWTGFAAVVGYLGAYAAVELAMDDPISFSDIPADATAEVFVATILSPDFVGRGTRFQEALTLAIATLILALVVARARILFFAQMRAEGRRDEERRAREAVARQLGRYVPEGIAKRLVAEPQAFAPQVTTGAVLVTDIEGFTAWANGRDPAEVIGTLNDFLAAAADEVGEAHGVVIAFTGDGLIATFNSPLEVEEPELKALAAARRLLEAGRRYGFGLRIGIAAGPMAAGSVGSSERQAFTVYGDTVNRAARLEALAKDLGVAVLVDETVGAAAGELFVSCGAHVLRGLGAPVRCFTPPPAATATARD